MSWGVGEGKERKRESEEREKSEQKKKKKQRMGKIMTSYRFFHSLIEIWECRDLDPTGYPK